MKTKLQETLSRANEVIFRYPMVLAMALLAAIGAICIVETERSEITSYIKFTICSCLGISLMFALKMLSQRIGKELLLHVSGIIFLIGFYCVLPDKKTALRKCMLISLLLLLYSLTYWYHLFLSWRKTGSSDSGSTTKIFLSIFFSLPYLQEF